MQNKAEIFEFSSYKLDSAERMVFFNYKAKFKDKKPIIFTETIILPKTADFNRVPKKLLKKLLECLHIMLGISYYKFHYATKIHLPYNLTAEEANFWNTAYKKGLGEFLYKNNLSPKKIAKFWKGKKIKKEIFSLPKSDKCLVGIGGGKDSIAAAELLKNGGFRTTAFFVKRRGISDLSEKVIKKIGLNALKIERILDKKVSESHPYDGHIPISAIYGFLGVFTAALYGYGFVIVGNERSSNFGNLNYKGLEINHQWSKSFEFEKLFQDYIINFLTPDVVYFSLLRPFYEIRIAEMFSKMKKYFPAFSSCNKNFSLKNKVSGGLWCNNCPKCVFVFILLSAFLAKKDLLKIFGKNLYEDKYLLPLFQDILGIGKMKPFDCVGTFEEAQTGLFLAKRRFSNSFIMRQIGNKAEYRKNVFLTEKENNIPEQFKFLGIKNVIILGHGIEGKVTKKYIKKYYPNLKIGIADADEGGSYLKKQEEFDFVVKTPGINKNLVKIPHTTATNIFFSKIKGKNLIIGVTGSKGKSTTASLIFEILKAGGKNIELHGNIGKPMLERLLKPVEKDKIFVLELSSFQLDDIKFSPDIAVITNLFPEHMDYHGSVEKYYEAKKNIINFQNEKEFFIYSPKNKIMKKWLTKYIGKAIPFAKNIPLKNHEISLLGEHNKSNISAAAAVARILGISDKIITEAVKNFKGLPHRLEFVGDYNGIRFYDDAISTTPESTIMAIKSIPNIGVIFLGGEDRGYNFSQLEKYLKKYKIKNIVLFPDSGKKILKDKRGLNILKTSNMETAVKFAYKNAPKGSACLLSCASPSYSLWKNFEEKGDIFKKAIRKLAKKL